MPIVIISVVSCTLMADCFDDCIQTEAFGTSSYQIVRFMQCWPIASITYTDPNLHLVLAPSMTSYRVWNETISGFSGQSRKILESVSLRLVDRVCLPFPIPYRDSSRNLVRPFLPASISISELEIHLCFAGRLHSYADQK